MGEFNSASFQFFAEAEEDFDDFDFVTGRAVFGNVEFAERGQVAMSPVSIGGSIFVSKPFPKVG